MDPPTAPHPHPSAGHFLTAPLPGLAAWKQRFLQSDIPVLSATSQRLAQLRVEEDKVDSAMLAGCIEQDPLMMVKLMALVATLRRAGDGSATETIKSSLVMMGVAPFFRHFGPQATVEQHLAALPAALEAVRALITRAERAAHFATGFAIHRQDTDVEVIRHAAFLHDFCELLMLCHAPTLALEVARRQSVDPTLRSAQAQQQVYGVVLGDLRQSLMRHWRLPDLLVRMTDEQHARHPTVRNVLLAVRLARHSEHGWDNAAIPDDIDDICALLNTNARVARGFIHKLEQGRLGG